MKTHAKTPIVMFLMLITAFALSACGKSSNNTTATQACSTTPYGTTSYYGNTSSYTSGIYYIQGTATQVSASSCSTVNGVATNGVTGTTYGTTICNGVYYSQQYGRYGTCQQISSYSSTCAGLVLINPSGQTVTCM